MTAIIIALTTLALFLLTTFFLHFYLVLNHQQIDQLNLSNNTETTSISDRLQYHVNASIDDELTLDHNVNIPEHRKINHTTKSVLTSPKRMVS